jgi:diguanylate cyclase (GGDEF)-like protein
MTVTVGGVLEDMDHACADRTCAFCKATSSTKRSRGNETYKPPMMHAYPVAQATQNLASWSRLQEMEQAFTSRTKLEELETMALIDRVTGISNSRTFLREYSREFARARRLKSNLSVCLVEVGIQSDAERQNPFTTVDNILRIVAGVIQAGLRETDVAGRYEKDCFAVVLSDCGTEGAWVYAERLRAAIHNELRTKQNYWGVSIKLAVASCPTHASEKESLIAKVSHALALSKGNNVEIVQAH